MAPTGGAVLVLVAPSAPSAPSVQQAAVVGARIVQSMERSDFWTSPPTDSHFCHQHIQDKRNDMLHDGHKDAVRKQCKTRFCHD